MKTIYIDVYFLLNFTVDLLAIYFASKIIRVNIKNIKLLLISFIGAMYSVLDVLISLNILLRALLFLFVSFIVILVMGRKISLGRRIKLFIAFFILMALIGGLVYFLYSLLARCFEYQPTAEPQNRKLLILSILIIASFSIIKLISALFARARSGKSAAVSIRLLDKRIACEALVDTGNLLKDPIDSTPVMMITRRIAERIMPHGIPEDVSSVHGELKRYVRIIPITKGKERVMCLGFLPEYSEVKVKNRWERVKLIFVIDNDVADFGGFAALIPASVLEI